MTNHQYSKTEKYRRAKERLQKYFESEIPMYILSDLKSLENIQCDENNKGLGLCAIPQAMFLFSIVNLFGYLMKESEKQQTREAFQYIFDVQCNLFPEIYFLNWEALLKLYRDGLMHQVFPKGCGISKGKVIALLLKKDEKGRIVNLNVNVFTRDLKSAIEKIKIRITSEECIDLAIRMNERLDKLADYDFRKQSRFS